jgi:hypothetical protein
MVFAMDMVSISQETVTFFYYVGGEGLARSSADAGANKTANHTANGADARSIASACAFALANLD